MTPCPGISGSIRSALLLAFVPFLLAGCGFQPLYETGGSSAVMRAELASVEIAPIPDRAGQVMRNLLIERLNTNSQPDFLLEIRLSKNITGFGIRPDSSATQEQLTVIAGMRLTDQKSGDIIIEQNFRARTAYDIVVSDFSTVNQREDAELRLVQELAEQLHRRLAIYFSRSAQKDTG